MNYITFNEKRIYYFKEEDNLYITLKSICEALNVNYHRQRENLLLDEELSKFRFEKKVIAADGKLRLMICVPEKFIYGWIFSLQSNSEELKKYRMKCYDTLYNHFKGKEFFQLENI